MTSVFIAVFALVVVVGALILLARSRRSLADRPDVSGGTSLGRLLRKGPGGPAWRELEEALLTADTGVVATAAIVSRVREAAPADAREAHRLLRSEMIDSFSAADRSLNTSGAPAVLVVVGVNGSGKTTTIAKIAHRLGDEGRAVVLGAADTFRAAAAEQLRVWGSRLGVEVISAESGADPASVAFDTVAAGSARGADVVIIDTAGRLHGTANLMEELAKIVRVAGKEHPVSEILLVIDGTTGQNAIEQARIFAESVGVTGIVVTKLEGSARGGIVLAIESSLGLPIKLIGVGEGLDDLRDFDPVAHVDRMLEDS